MIQRPPQNILSQYKNVGIVDEERKQIFVEVELIELLADVGSGASE
jgi:hypothetical protein